MITIDLTMHNEVYKTYEEGCETCGGMWPESQVEYDSSTQQWRYYASFGCTGAEEAGGSAEDVMNSLDVAVEYEILDRDSVLRAKQLIQAIDGVTP